MLLSFLGRKNACPIVRYCIYARCALTVRMPERVPHLPGSSSATVAFLWGPPLLFLPYSPECVEGTFSEVQLRGAERRSVTKVMSSSCSQPSPTKEYSSSIRKSTSHLSSSCSATSLRSLGKPNIS